ncbi:hypothetical protein HY572_05950 [Candidatus Micrarchaeota archaeon]|nr:hypothetical protein [Candidatus Micrarchaeota archaeon]
MKVFLFFALLLATASAVAVESVQGIGPKNPTLFEPVEFKIRFSANLGDEAQGTTHNYWLILEDQNHERAVVRPYGDFSYYEDFTGYKTITLRESLNIEPKYTGKPLKAAIAWSVQDDTQTQSGKAYWGNANDFKNDVIVFQAPASDQETVGGVLLDFVREKYARRDFQAIHDALFLRPMAKLDSHACDINAYWVMSQVAIKKNPFQDDEFYDNTRHPKTVFENWENCLEETKNRFTQTLSSAVILDKKEKDEYVLALNTQTGFPTSTTLNVRNSKNQEVRIRLADVGAQQVRLELDASGESLPLNQDGVLKTGLTPEELEQHPLNNQNLGLTFELKAVKAPLVLLSVKRASGQLDRNGNCRFFAGKPDAAIHVAVAPHEYRGNQEKFEKDLQKAVWLLEQTLQERFDQIKISVLESEVPCVKKNRHLFCDTSFAQAACNTDYVYVHANEQPFQKGDKTLLRGIRQGNQANCPANAPECFRHELGHLWFGLSDRYCCDGGYFPPTVYADEAKCRSTVQRLYSKTSAELQKKFTRHLASFLDKETAPDGESVLNPYGLDATLFSLSSQQRAPLLKTPQCKSFQDVHEKKRFIFSQDSVMKKNAYPAFSIDELAAVDRVLKDPEGKKTGPIQAENAKSLEFDGHRAKKVLHAKLEFHDNKLAITDAILQYADAQPTLISQPGGIQIAFFDADGQSVVVHAIPDPRHVFIDDFSKEELTGGFFVDPDASFSLRLPFPEEAKTLEFYDESGLLLRTDVDGVTSNFCQTRTVKEDDYCEPLCQSDADCTTVNAVPASVAPTPAPPIQPASTTSADAFPVYATAFLVVLVLAFYAVFWRKTA